MTTQGGSDDDGIIFSIDTNGSYFKDLLDFSGGVNGKIPVGSLTLSGSVLFGMTGYGGSGYGNIFHIDTTGNNYKDLFSFNGTTGSQPFCSLTLSGNIMYGMASAGGADGSGCIFSIDTNGGQFVDRFDFNGTNGATPNGALTLSASGKTLFGMTFSGGTHDSGCVFSIDTNGSSYKILLNSRREYGAKPLGYGSLLLTGNVLYGMTTTGGTDNDGIIFKLDTNNNVSTSISEIPSIKGSISVYPNPSNGNFTLSLSNVNSTCNLEIYNILGDKVYAENLPQTNNNIINLTGQPNGVYLYRMLSKDGSLIGEGKLIIQK